MSVDTDGTLQYAPQYRQPFKVRQTGYMVRKETLVRVLLTTMLYVSLWRATGMWYGYPAVFGEGGDGGDSTTAMKVLLYSLIPLTAVYVVLEPRRVLGYIKSTPILVVIVVFFCLTSLSVSIDVGASTRGLAALTLLTVAPLLYRLRYGSVETFRVLSNFSIAVAFLNIIYTAVLPRFAIMGGSYAGMVKGLFYHKNIMGQFCAIAVIVLISMPAPSLRIRWSSLLRFVAIMLLLVLVVLSRSSTAVVMVGAGIGTIAGVRIMQRVPGTLLRGALLMGLFFLIGLAASTLYLGLAAAIAESFGKDLTFSGRTNIWEQLIPLVYEQPIFGYGYAVFRQPWVMEQYVSVTFDARSVHNTYLGIALDIGVPAMIAWTLFALKRLSGKIVLLQRESEVSILQAKEVAIILLVLTGAMMEASMMLAPSVLWPILVVTLPFQSNRPDRK